MVTSVRQGQWGNGGTWDTGKVPTATDPVTIKHVVTISKPLFQCAGIEVQAGGRLKFSPKKTVTLESTKNVVIRGELVMKPAASTLIHTLRFVNVDESKFGAGGGMAPVDTDVGLWVPDAGKLTLQGSPKAGWNRTGDDASWVATDELVVTPVQYGEGIESGQPFKSFTKGGTVPSVTFAKGTDVELTVFAEVANLTRNVRVEGTPGHRAHIWISTTSMQTIKFVAIRHMGPRKGVGQGSSDVLGRYGLHIHHCDDALAGSVIEGVVVRDCGSHAFAPHNSHHITFRDCISYNTYEDAYWWDPPAGPQDLETRTSHTLFDHCMAALVRSDPDYEGYRLAGFLIGVSDDFTNEWRNCVAVAVQGQSDAGGFVWPEIPQQAPAKITAIATFKTGNVAHNNSCMGGTVWQVNDEDHVVEDFLVYHNGKCGIFNGAYANAYEWEDTKVYANGGSHHDKNTIPHTQFFAWTGPRDVGDVKEGRNWMLCESVVWAEGRTQHCVIVAGRAVVDLKLDNGQPGEPGDFIGTRYGGAPIAHLWSFSFHDFGQLEHQGYLARWHLGGNTYEPGMKIVVGDMGGVGIHPDSVIFDDDADVTYHPPTYPQGTLNQDWNVKIVQGT